MTSMHGYMAVCMVTAGEAVVLDGQLKRRNDNYVSATYCECPRKSSHFSKYQGSQGCIKILATKFSYAY